MIDVNLKSKGIATLQKLISAVNRTGSLQGITLRLTLNISTVHIWIVWFHVHSRELRNQRTEKKFPFCKREVIYTDVLNILYSLRIPIIWITLRPCAFRKLLAWCYKYTLHNLVTRKPIMHYGPLWGESISHDQNPVKKDQWHIHCNWPRQLVGLSMIIDSLMLMFRHHSGLMFRIVIVKTFWNIVIVGVCVHICATYSIQNDDCQAIGIHTLLVPCRCHDAMETLSALLALFEKNPSVTAKTQVCVNIFFGVSLTDCWRNCGFAGDLGHNGVNLTSLLWLRPSDF